MKRYWFGIVPVFFMVVFLCVAPARAVRPADVRSFLRSHYPYLTGTIVSERDGRYHARIRTNLSEPTVDIYRADVVNEDGARRLMNRSIGRTVIHTPDTRASSFPLNLPETLKNKVRLGDKLRLPPRVLLLRNKTKLDTPSIAQAARSVDRVDTVVLTEYSAAGESYQLEIHPDRLVLSLTGPRTMTIAEEKIKSRTIAETSRRTINEIGTIDRIIRDIEWIDRTGNTAGHNLILAAESRLGFATADSDSIDVSWQKLVTGRILDVSVAPREDGSGGFFLVLVRDRSGTIRSDYYTLDVTTSSLENHWTRSNVWIHETGGAFYRQRIGLHSPFEVGLRRVTLSPDGFKLRGTLSSLRENYYYSPSYIVADTTVYALNKQGKLEIFRDGRRIKQTSERYGNSPRRVTARRSESGQTLNPEFITWVDESGKRNLLVPRNIASGLTAFRGLTYYESSRLYRLGVKPGGFERIWESNRLPGYLSSMTYGNGAAFLTVVNNEEQLTRLFRVGPKTLR